MSLLSIKNLCVEFGHGHRAFKAVDGVDLAIDRGCSPEASFVE